MSTSNLAGLSSEWAGASIEIVTIPELIKPLSFRFFLAI